MSATSLARRRRSLRWRSPISLGEALTWLAITALLMMPALALEAAGWGMNLRVVLPVLALGTIFGLVVGYSRFGEIAASILCLLYGVGAALMVAAWHAELPFMEAIAAIVERAAQWTIDALSGGINTDELILTLLVSLLFWALAFNAGWHAFRLNRVWRVILPPGLIMLVNMVLYSDARALDAYLVIYLLMALALVLRSNLNGREWEWRISGIRVPTVVRRQFAAIGLIMSLAGLALAWSMPTGALQERLDAFQQFLASDPIRQMSEVWSRLFAPIEGDGPATTDYYGADLLNLSGAVSLGDEVVLLVDAPTSVPRYFWRSRVFERYIDGQWSPSADLRVTDRSAPMELTMNIEAQGYRRQEIRQRFTIGALNSRLFYAAPQPSIIDSAGRIDLIFTDKPDNTSMNVSVMRPLRALKSGDEYSAVSLMSNATADELRGAAARYPEWVSGPNLYVGQPSSPIFNLAQQIVTQAGANNAYDRAKAIESWLRRSIRYNESISAPPPDVDVVEWLLFDAREGYCTYYATAMIVMLRHLGIPARLAAGFSQGEYDSGINRYVVRERQAHTWVEVFFPGYGWISFEPTAAQAPYNREGDDLAQQQPDAVEPQPTLSPTPSPSPTPTPPPTPQGQEAFDRPPTPTPSPTPTPQPPSPTPIIIPTAQPPIFPDDPPPLAFLQPLLLIVVIAALSLALILLLLLLLFWWWEWRGFGGLSPISRAYARLERYIQLIGISIGSDKTTLEKQRELQQRIPAARDSIRTISDLYTRERYGGDAQDPGENARYAASAERAWYRTRGNIIRRWLRRILPWGRPRE